VGSSGFCGRGDPAGSRILLSVGVGDSITFISAKA